jgi:putative chitinase
MTKEQLTAATACTPQRAGIFFDALVNAMEKFEINTPKRQAAFLAQVAHESGSLKYVEEIASGDAYDTRVDLGNTPERDGDGARYKGRGLIQITGKANYAAVGKALQYDFVKHPEGLEMPGAASMSAAWFWKSRGLNELADVDDFLKISVKINGRNKKTGLPNGWEDRQRKWAVAKKALGI